MFFLKMVIFVTVFLNILFVIGNLFINFFSKKSKFDNSFTILLGLSISLILLNIFYFVIGFTLNNSIYFLLFIIICLYALNNFDFKLIFKLSLILKFLILSIAISIIAYFTPEQVFIFRGNYWDKINYINAAYSIFNFQFNEIINLSDQLINLKFLSRLENIQHRPLISLILSMSYYLNETDIFRIFFLIQLLFTVFIFLSLRIFFSKFINNSFIIVIIFIFSFWNIYIFEIDAYSHFFSIPIFNLCLSYLIEIDRKILTRNNFKVLILSIFSLALYYLYTELFFIFASLFLTFVLIKFKISNSLIFFKKNILIFMFFLIGIILSFENNFLSTLNQIEIAYFSNVDWWGYYGGFLFGKDVQIFNSIGIDNVAEIFFDSNNIFTFFNSFLELLSEQNLLYLFLNIIPSFFGFYYLSITEVNFINVLYIFILNIFIIKIIIDNFKIIINSKKNITLLIKISIILFVFLSITLIFGNNIWSIIKLYSYLGIFIFIFVTFKFQKGNNIKINKIIIIMTLIFPLYKYSEYNYGIFKYDTFPSIINKKLKTEINWNFRKLNITDCKKILVDIEKELIVDYVRIKLLSYNYNNVENYVFINNENGKKLNCKLYLFDEKFKIEKRN